MQLKIAKASHKITNVVYIADAGKIGKLSDFSKAEFDYIKSQSDAKKSLIQIQRLHHLFFVVLTESKPDTLAIAHEGLRDKGNKILAALNAASCEEVLIVNLTESNQNSLLIAEGLALSNYQFLKYLKDKKEKTNSMKTIFFSDKNLKEAEVSELENLIEATYLARTLINEPLSYLTAVQFAKDMQKAGKQSGFGVKVLNKKEIEEHKMGGLLAVNAGSIDPPTFTVMEYKPKNAKNKKPIVLVGKGVVFDTGGLSLKPTPGSMDEMKCDMSGGAAVVGTLYAVAANKLPVYVVGLVPATDNRPGMNAVVPQDIITISDGTTVEVLNTDAEGRLILADALVYAKKYQPEICIDLATLTGAAVRAIGSYASAIMGTASEESMKKLGDSGMQTWERTVAFPMWKEYGDEMKSDIADLKNLGGANAGHISAGKFLEHFTNYPWIHIDIAGPAYINSHNSYRTKGGTGVGVRMLYHFIKTNYAK
jgi:leucyl aminopeptidase